MKINERFLKGTFCVPMAQTIDGEKEYSVNLVVNPSGFERKPLENGTYNDYYKVKATLVTMLNDLGERITVPKQKGSLSQQNQQMLSQLWKKEISQKTEVEFLTFYADWWKKVDKLQAQIIESILKDYGI